MTLFARALSLIALAALLGLPLGASGATQVGTVVQLAGEAVVKRGGQDLPATVGMPLEVGDTLLTAEAAKAQIRMQDDAVFAVVQKSAFKVEQHSAARQGGAGTAIFSLLRGGFRTVTGLIGKGKQDAYEVRTAVATIGVRGTSYAALLCDEACGARFLAGLYVKADHGTVVVKNAHGQVMIRSGEVAFVGSADVPPIKVKVSPFSDPAFAADFRIDIEFDLEVEPPRIEQELPPSPS